MENTHDFPTPPEFGDNHRVTEDPEGVLMSLIMTKQSYSNSSPSVAMSYFYKMLVFLGSVQDAGVNHCPRLHQLPHPVAQLFYHIATIVFSSESWEKLAIFQGSISSSLCSHHRPNDLAVHP